MPITATATTTSTKGKNSPSRVTSPAKIRAKWKEMEALAIDIENLSRQIDANSQAIANLATIVTVLGQSTFTATITGITGSSVIDVVDGQIVSFTP